MRKNSIKNVRINSEVQRALGELIRMGVKDPRVSSLTSVTDVEVAPDLKTAKVFVSVLGEEAKGYLGRTEKCDAIPKKPTCKEY